MIRPVPYNYRLFALMLLLLIDLPIHASQLFAMTVSSNESSEAEVGSELSPEKVSGLALQYAKAMAAGQVKKWAALDLGCLAKQQQLGAMPNEQVSESVIKACWNATMNAHRKLVADETEPGIFGALGRGTGFGLIHESHQHADFWVDYPPALAVSPEVVREDPESPVPLLRVEKVLKAQAAGLVIEDRQDPAEVQKISVDLSVIYPDPLTAPLALLPDEPWWASPVIRKYAPVRKLVARFTIARGLKAIGYPVEQAVVNEALPGAPRIAEPSAPGILPSSPEWWSRSLNPKDFEAGIQQARETASFQERVRKFRRILLLDPVEPRINAMYGMDLYLAFLQEGLKKGKITSKVESLSQKLGELYWNIQAQTWRQEFTEVAVGHSSAAEAFYQAIPALEIALKGGEGHAEMQRRLGALYRWNNDTTSALTIHEELLSNVSPGDLAGRSQILSEIAWDRVQWLSWNRRYDHPWMTQAREEAEQSLSLARSPIDKLLAGEALVILDALAVPRDESRLQKHVAMVRTYHEQLSGVAGIWKHLIGNDLVKSLVPEGLEVQMPTPVRSPEVMPLDVHSRIQDRNFFRTWNFDQDAVGKIPSGFSAGSTQERSVEGWRIETDSQAPSSPNVVTQASSCEGDTCFQVLLGDRSTHELPDIVVYIRKISTMDQGEAGIALAAKDPQNFYAVTLNSTKSRLSIYRVQNGKPLLLGKGAVKLKRGPWHVLRVQMVNSAHVDHPLLEIYVDGRETAVMASEPIKGRGHVGLVTKGNIEAQFDRLGVIEMMTSRPMSKPAAY